MMSEGTLVPTRVGPQRHIIWGLNHPDALGLPAIAPGSRGEPRVSSLLKFRGGTITSRDVIAP